MILSIRRITFGASLLLLLLQQVYIMNMMMMLRSEYGVMASYPTSHSQLAFITKDREDTNFRRRRIASNRYSSPTSTTVLRYTNQNIDETTTSTASSSSSSSSKTSTVVTTIAETSLTGVVMDITFSQHRPLGCVIEESLVSPPVTTITVSLGNIVFITSVTANGFAQQAGLLVGDVIIGVSTAFTTTNNKDECNVSSLPSTIMDVTGFGIERVYVIDDVCLISFCFFKTYIYCTSLLFLLHSTIVISCSKSLIMCRHDNEPFTLQVLRGTTALQDHEVALTELCSNPDTTSTEAEQCMIDYIQGAYATDDSKVVNMDSIPEDGECTIVDTTDMDDGECLLNDMHSLWASDLPMSSSLQQQEEQNGKGINTSQSQSNSATGKAVKPWSSRASPSGTFVRDPTTGKMKNLESSN